MPAATPATIRSWMARDSGRGRVWASAPGFVAVVFMVSSLVARTRKANREDPPFHPDNSPTGSGFARTEHPPARVFHHWGSRGPVVNQLRPGLVSLDLRRNLCCVR